MRAIGDMYITISDTHIGDMYITISDTRISNSDGDITIGRRVLQ
jgi:hypothetical protein